MLSRNKKIIFSIAAFFLALTVILIIIEILFRIFNGAPNPLNAITQINKAYLFQPNKTIPSKSSIDGEFNYTALINSFGYRGAEFNKDKKDKIRIFAVGDSFTFGVGAEDDQTIPAVLEKELNKKNIPTEIINAGIGHASPIYHYVNLRDIHLKYKPDMVVLLLDLTDLQDDWWHERQAVYDKAGDIKAFDETYLDGNKNWWLTLTFYCASWKKFDSKVLRSFKKMRLLGRDNYTKITKEGKRAKAIIVNSPDGEFSDETIFEYDAMLMMRGKPRERLIRKQFERTAKYLLKIKNLLDQNHIPMILVMYPHGIYVGDQQWKDGRETWGFDNNKTYTDYFAFDLVKEFAQKNNISFINTLDSFLKADKNIKYYYDWDGHMTPVGYNIAATSIHQNKVFQDILKKLSIKQIPLNTAAQ